ncbi:hypothetical protein JCGZ_23026 [Jatropha curcas]|uniref:Uncharacterized protein n=1 Tax=Jatropha curcas TaxID=180498 RepID=A0A067L9C5_JATCU|nr:uncharacterized protein LOC105628496 [Jatropha curcas]XP_012065304.1 uncharacterized protein LOC105628496 [Jatropha curcas]KDP43818.1 hypothetical protein JCGZ_23026 [Jatropha curcas]
MACSDYEDDYFGGSDFGDDFNEEPDSYGLGSDSEDDYNEKSDFDEDNYHSDSEGVGSDLEDNHLQQSNSQQSILKNSIVDKKTGSYARTTMKQSYSSGDVFKERSTGRVGYKDEFKTTKTFKVGDKRGYTEHQVEERYRRVDYGNSSSSSRGKNSCCNSKGKNISSSNKKYLK